MIAGDPPIPIPPATSPLPSLVLDLEPTVAGPPQGIDLGQMYEKHLYYVRSRTHFTTLFTTSQR